MVRSVKYQYIGHQGGSGSSRGSSTCGGRGSTCSGGSSYPGSSCEEELQLRADWRSRTRRWSGHGLGQQQQQGLPLP